ncbi:MAG: sugar phosphate isomerase/epimerase [Bryobacteraceae bacterium]|jgi:sugar phosphate isomerase/epimerase
MMHEAAELNGGLVKSSSTHATRRAILQSAVAIAASRAATTPWKPKLGIYCRYSPANIAFAGEEGFTGVQLAAGGLISPDSTEEQLAEVKRSLSAHGLTLVALNGGGNHLDPAAQQRFVKMIELAGRLGVSYIGGSSGAIAGRRLDEQVQAIVKAYESQYFPSCEKYKVRILWEPYVNPANIATSPVAFSALLHAFNDSPYVGIQMDPSHLAWQMIDPVEATREFGKYIFNVHLKDTEILWPLVRRGGIQPIDNAKWWRFRLPGSGVIDWKGFFTALADAGYAGGMNIENEDQFYYPNYDGDNFTEAFKEGFRVAHAYVRQFVPPGAQK